MAGGVSDTEGGGRGDARGDVAWNSRSSRIMIILMLWLYWTGEKSNWGAQVTRTFDAERGVCTAGAYCGLCYSSALLQRERSLQLP